MTQVSAIGTQLSLVTALQNEQSNLGILNQQLATGTVHNNLTDYNPVDARNMVDFQNAIIQRQSYNAAMQNVQTRLSLYDTTMSDVENMAEQANTLATQHQIYDPTAAANLQAQVQNFLKQTTDDLNQKVGDRYIYAGTRYTTAPVTDLTTLTSAPSATPTTQPVLPSYDAEYNAGTTSDANAYTKDAVLVDTNYTVTYGVSSADPAFQQVISGLRFMSSAIAAGQSGDTATYQTDMQQAATLLSAGLTAVQGVHAGVANNQNVLTQKTDDQNTNITNLQDQVTNIQKVDLTEVGAKITLLQTQLQASYSATASLEQLSLVKYL